jgi:hypothetical protein
MNNVQRLASSIRNYVNTANLYDKYYKDNLDSWNMLCVSMDVIEDTCEALQHFEAEGIGDGVGEKYLKLYGVLQAVSLQQDAIKYLCQSLSKVFPKLKGLVDWRESQIRKLRNLTVGHPIEMTRDKIVRRCFITRASISPHGFKLMVYNAAENKDEFEDRDLRELYSGYKKEATTVLEKILNNLEGGER